MQYSCSVTLKLNDTSAGHGLRSRALKVSFKYGKISPTRHFTVDSNGFISTILAPMLRSRRDGRMTNATPEHGNMSLG